MDTKSFPKVQVDLLRATNGVKFSFAVLMIIATHHDESRLECSRQQVARYVAIEKELTLARKGSSPSEPEVVSAPRARLLDTYLKIGLHWHAEMDE